jgi:hypothetical protein
VAAEPARGQRPGALNTITDTDIPDRLRPDAILPRDDWSASTCDQPASSGGRATVPETDDLRKTLQPRASSCGIITL